MAITRYLMWAMSGCWRIEIPMMQLLEKIGEANLSELFPFYPEFSPTVMGEEIEMNEFDKNGVLHAVNGPFIRKGGASNSWTVSRSLSSTNSAILCNDTHLALSCPAIWYMNHLMTIINGKKKINVTGISCPGTLFVLICHNQYFAWGSTLARSDGEDLFSEKLDGTTYEFKGEWKEAEVVEEVINIKDKPPHTEKVIITHHGPIISKSLNETSKVIAYNGMSLRPTPIIQSYYKINTGSDWDDFVDAIRICDAPQINMSYADINGNTGWYVSGKLPIRSKSLGTTPVPGWTGEDEWIDEIPFEQMPHAYNPKNGIIVTCNNKIAPDSYPYFLGDLFLNGNRARRIIEYIRKKGKMEYPEDHMKLQNDVKSVSAIDLIEYIQNYHSENDDIELMLSVLKSWDGYLSIDSTPGLYYEVLKQSLKKNIFLPILGEELMKSLFGWIFEENPILGNFTDILGLDGSLILKLLNNPDSWWIQKTGGKERILKNAFTESIKWLKSEFGDKWICATWGEVHHVTIPHVMSAQKPMDEVFNVGGKDGKPIGGDVDTPNVTAMNPANPYNQEFLAAVFRQIVDLGNLENSYFIYPTGQSGNLASPHYNDMFEMWRTGKYLKINWSDKQIEDDKESELVLKP